ncbi:MAG: hypothetical protein HON47_04440 [Candidatus Diapherotrites archaeon]|jgi:hypothetical protein|uniref:Uncharacterized protein n=1 Tax=Candidatus Iainarchaeum sp. TaxID=3101447 RepID=A0A8T5GGF3_9ARCH|nr:hypothetical protein [Candidatus Diapherotrites archaeon]MBT7241373.1 hypothetical protein [Candidatus Diapherotrites archaeon]
MNRRGLMFTLEVMIAIIILAIAMGVVLTGNNSEIENQNLVNLSNQSKRITAVYFNENYVNTTGDLIVCGDYFEYFLGSILRSSICEGYT